MSPMLDVGTKSTLTLLSEGPSLGLEHRLGHSEQKEIQK